MSEDLNEIVVSTIKSQEEAIGLVELNSIALGMQVTDTMLKTSDVQVLVSRSICSGKYMVMVGGTVADVRSSVDAGVEDGDIAVSWLAHKVEAVNLRILDLEIADSVETALKLARRWGYRVKGIPDDEAKVVVCEGNFHGRTTTIVGFSEEEQYRDGFGPFTPGFKVIPYVFGEELFVDIQPVIPTPEAADFMIGMAEKETEARGAQGQQKSRQ